MKRNEVKIFVVFFMLLLSACNGNIFPIKKSAFVDQKSGVLLASVTTYGGNNATFYYKKAGLDKNYYLAAKYENLLNPISHLMFSDDYSDDNSRWGKLVALKLDVGRYYLTDSELYAHEFQTGYIFKSKNFKPLEFVVEAGKITYIGNLHIQAIQEKNSRGFLNVVSGVSSVSDRGNVDINILSQKYPNLSAWPIKNAVPIPAVDTPLFLHSVHRTIKRYY